MQPTRDQILKSVFTKRTSANVEALSLTYVFGRFQSSESQTVNNHHNLQKKQTFCCGDLKAKDISYPTYIPLHPWKINMGSPTNDQNLEDVHFPFQLGWFLASNVPHLHLVQSEGPSGIVRRNTPDLVPSQLRSSRRCCWCWQYSWKGEKIFSEVFPQNWGSSSHCRVFVDWLCFHDFSTENSAY